MYWLFCVVLCIVCVYVYTVLLPPGGYPIAVNKYYIISCCVNSLIANFEKKNTRDEWSRVHTKTENRRNKHRTQSVTYQPSAFVGNRTTISWSFSLQACQYTGHSIPAPNGFVKMKLNKSDKNSLYTAAVVS